MLERISGLMDDHPQLYLLAAALFVYASAVYVRDADDMLRMYAQAKQASREVSEALGG